MATKIDITTTQHVTIEYELASLRDRILAYLIDAVIIVVLYFVVILGALQLFAGAVTDGSSMSLYIVYALSPLLLFLFYHLLSEILADGQSWGKKAMSLKVVRLDGKEPGLTDYLLRAVFHIIDSVFSLGIIGAMLISSSAKNQRLGDLTANTAVIRLKNTQQFRLEDILKINSIEDYEPKYLEVTQLSEQDMLLIKSVLGRHQRYRNEAHRQAIKELAEHLAGLLDIDDKEQSQTEFLKTLIRDYIVLTR
ncbi:MAG: RDD family protein [Bacteroidota bacterium]